jgi:pyridoxine 5'-phosphate synthase PdxJ
LQIPGILEVSIGHAIVVESLEMGVQQVMHAYQNIIHQTA